jgi:hypothetical protein
MDERVYAAVLDFIRLGEEHRLVEYLVVAADELQYAYDERHFTETQTEDSATWATEAFPGLSRECVENLVRTDDQGPSRLPQLTASVPVRMVDSGRVSELRESGNFWSGFWQANPNTAGLIQLSTIGFNSAYDQALVYASVAQGDLARVSFLVYLVRDPDWRIESRRLVSVS